MRIEPGTRLGPYEVLAPLGAGGMGEVYRARDPRLGREVAVKVLHEEVAKDPDRLKRFEHEAKAVGALNHPNILTVHDVGTHEGSPYVVTELLEGETLREVLQRRSPTVRQVLAWGAQAAQGLSAAHQKGIVHRDVKPENLFLTTDGRVKVLDFGLAKLVAGPGTDTGAMTASGPSEVGVVLGTIAYMSPEQVGAEGLDHRTDLFSLGIVLYELLAREHPFLRATVPATLTAILHETPPELSVRQPGVSPAVDRVVRKCLAKGREERYQSARDLGQALVDVVEGKSATAALRDVEERSPYPGLSSFTEEDSGRFFGREEEVAALWRRLRERRLLAVIGPSGAGKSSFVRAGVVASRPEGWAAIVATPGNAPLRGLGQSLAPHLASDAEALRKLLAFDDPEVAIELFSRWRKGHDEALVVVDQFEELFTLNPPEVQARFASLLGRLASEAEVHVLLSLRDDFVMRCSEQPALAPVFEALTPLPPMTNQGLRRALVEPASRRGYRFEDEALVDEMVAAVEGARGALPLLAFAVSRLWEKRETDRKLLTRDAYVEIGGVAGALARHAEETLERIGAGQEGIVRGIFRNLTTAQGTRTVLEREELLSSLPDRAAAESVLAKLIDARLLTTWETEAVEGQPARHRVEIVHESLLSAWPRLVRWQTQDADGAQLRDQLRQAAHLWEERGKAEDLLWTGTSYLDYRAWRARYPGKLSSLEEEYSGSMTARAERTRRRRRAAFGAVVLGLAVGLGMTFTLWKRSEAAGRRAEASKLLALAQLEIDKDPGAALAYALRSLELNDTEVVRLFALRVTQSAPVESVLPGVTHACFSPGGEWMAGLKDRKVLLFDQDGRRTATIDPGTFPAEALQGLVFLDDGKTLAMLFRDEVRHLSVPEGRELRRVRYAPGAVFWSPISELAFFNYGYDKPYEVFRRPWDGSAERRVGAIRDQDLTTGMDNTRDFAALAWASGRKICVRSADRWADPPRVVGEHPEEVTQVDLTGDGRRVAAVDTTGQIRVWDTASSSGRPVRVLPLPPVKGPSGSNAVWYTRPASHWLMSDWGGEGRAVVRCWRDGQPPGAAPVLLRANADAYTRFANADPLERLFVWSDTHGRLVSWPLPSRPPLVFEWHEGVIRALAFAGDGSAVVAATTTGLARAWPLSPEASEDFRTLPETTGYPSFAVAPAGRRIAVGSAYGLVQIVPVDGGPARELSAPTPDGSSAVVAFSPGGRLLAAASGSAGPAAGKRVRVWDLDSGEMRLLDAPPGAVDGPSGTVASLSFAGEDRIVATVRGTGLVSFDLRDGKGRVTSPKIVTAHAVGRSGRIGAGLACAGDGQECELFRIDTGTGAAVALPYRVPGRVVRATSVPAVDPAETLVASAGPGDSVRVGSLSGGEPHLLFGHRGAVHVLAFSPDGRWLASAGNDQTVRVWPVPDVTKVPPHRRSREEFLATLRTFTNLRAVPDPAAANGWKVEPGPFPAWKIEPHW